MQFKCSTMVEYDVVGDTVRSFGRKDPRLLWRMRDSFIMTYSQDLPVRRQWLHSGP